MTLIGGMSAVLVKGCHLVELTLCGCVISICCVGFASLVVCDELNDCAWNLGP